MESGDGAGQPGTPREGGPLLASSPSTSFLMAREIPKGGGGGGGVGGVGIGGGGSGGGYQLPEEELCSFQSSLALGPLHICSQLLNNLSFSDPYPQVPPAMLITPHDPGAHVLISFNTNRISVPFAGWAFP